MNKTAVIIVTHNSAPYLEQCIPRLEKQTLPADQIIIVDSGSKDTAYLEKYRTQPNVLIHVAHENVGFCVGNNLGVLFVNTNTKYVLFLNPDAFLEATFIEQAVAYMEEKNNLNVGAVTGLLLGYDLKQNQPTGKIDSSGIFRTWYGRWFDRGQGKTFEPLEFKDAESIPAICGALFFCRKEALSSVSVQPYQAMDPTFYMYKEDIDLSMRLRKKGWDLQLLPWLRAHHCRGWQTDRSFVPQFFRLLSAKNEMRLHAKTRSPCVLYSLTKYLAVKLFNI